MQFIHKFQRDYNPANPNGRAAAAASEPMVLSTEDKAVLDDIATKTGVVPSGGATAALQGTGNTSLATIAGKDFATSALQTAGNGSLSNILTQLGTMNGSQSTSALQTTGNTTLASILAKIIASPATEATLAAILSKIIATPATEAKQDAGNTSLATIAAKDFATATNQVDQLGVLTSLDEYLNDISAGVGTSAETPAASDTATSGLVGLFKRLLAEYISTIVTAPDTDPSGKKGIMSMAISTDANPTYDENKLNPLSQDKAGNTRVRQLSSNALESKGASVAMTVTALHSLANSATACWQSDRISNYSVLATDYEIYIKIVPANTIPGSDKCFYAFLCPFYTTDGSTWYANSVGTATLPTGSQGTITIAEPNNLILLGALNYTTQNGVVQGTFLVSNAYGGVPDGWSIIIKNFSGAAIAASGSMIEHRPINIKHTV